MTVLIDFHFIGGSRGQALAALKQLYPDYSARRRFLKLVNTLNQVGLRLCPRGMAQLGRAGEALPSLRSRQSRALLLHKLGQNGRAYAFDWDCEGRALAVTKLATTEAAAHGVRREARVLQMLAGRTVFHVPEVLHFENWVGGCLLRMTVAPEGYTAHDKAQPLPCALFDAVAALRTGAASLPARDFDGWRSALGRATESAICIVAEAIELETRFAATCAHRDLGSENIFSCAPAKAAADFCLIDWEYFAETAPALTDRVGVWLGLRHRAFKGYSGPSRAALVAEFLADFETAPGGRAAAVLALLHLAEMGIDLARHLTGDTA